MLYHKHLLRYIKVLNYCSNILLENSTFNFLRYPIVPTSLCRTCASLSVCTIPVCPSYSVPYLIVPLGLCRQILRLLQSTEQILQPGKGPPLIRRHLVGLLGVAAAVHAGIVVLGVVSASGAAVEAVGVGRRLAVAEVAGMAATSDAACHARLLDGLADHDAVLLELLG